MAAQTVLDLSLTASVPGGNPAIVVTVPLTRPSAADHLLQKSPSAGLQKPMGMVTLRRGFPIGYHAASSPYTNAFREHTRAIVNTRDITNRLKLQLSDIRFERLHHARCLLTVAPFPEWLSRD